MDTKGFNIAVHWTDNPLVWVFSPLEGALQGGYRELRSQQMEESPRSGQGRGALAAVPQRNSLLGSTKHSELI
jgi:hypothetical protein